MSKTSLAAIAAALAVCSAPSHAGWTDGSFGGLSAKIYIPNTTASSRMLFVNLHGCAQKPTDLVKSDWDLIAEKYNAVVVLPTSGAQTLVGCWNYGNSSIAMSDFNAVVSGTRTVIADAKYGIDHNQVYISGTSSGATFAAAIGCSFPDIYAGVGSASGPTIGSNQMNAMSGETPSVTKAVNWCRTQANGKEAQYKTQLYAQSYGADPASGDGIIGKGFILPNREVQLQLYGLTGGSTYAQDQKFTNTAGHTSTTETEYSVFDANGAKRASLIVIPGMGHAWPSGNPASGSVGAYVKTNFDFGTWMAVNFTANNCRLPANQGKAICGTPPEEVQNLACKVTKTSATLTWDKPGVAVDGYNVTNVTTNQAVKTTATSALWSNLTTGVKYTFSVAATNGSATYKAKNIDCTPAPISAVTGLTATPDSTSVALAWTGVDAAAKYLVSRNGAAISSVTTTSATDSNLAAETTYRYCVKAVDRAGEESADSCVDTKTKPIQCWAQTVSATCSTHYVAKRLNLSQYLACGSKVGYMASTPLYGFGNPLQWSNKSDCSPMGF
ncbi:MAG: fibronectin type III domain-containing protein [Betaproteobacteria bacterium]